MNVRFIFAINKNLERSVEEGRFRMDLNYRIKVYTIHLTDLRERTEDIPELVEIY